MALPLVGSTRSRRAAIWLIVVARRCSSPASPRSCSIRRSRNRDVSIPVLLLMLLSPAVFTNLRIGQGYLIVFGLFAATAVLLMQRTRSRSPGVCLGSLARAQDERRRDRAPPDRAKRWMRAGVRRSSPRRSSRIAITPFIDAAMWWMFPSQVRAFVARPSGSVTAYQTTLEPGAALVRGRSAMESVARRELRADRVHGAGAGRLPPPRSSRWCWRRRSRPGRAVDRRRRDPVGAVAAGSGRAAFRPDGDSAGAAAADDHRNWS